MTPAALFFGYLGYMVTLTALGVWLARRGLGTHGVAGLRPYGRGVWA